MDDVDAVEDAAEDENEDEGDGKLDAAAAGRKIDMNCVEARSRMAKEIQSKWLDKATVRWAGIRWNDCYYQRPWR